MFICTWFLFLPPPLLCKFSPPLQGTGAKKHQGGPNIFGSLRSPVRPPLSKTLKPPLVFWILSLKIMEILLRENK